MSLKQNGGFPGGSDDKRIHLLCRRPGFDPWVGKIPWRKGNGNSLQASFLGNSMDRGGWQAAVHRVAKSRKGLSN